MPKQPGPIILAVCMLAAIAVPAAAQRENPVYVDDSPQAWELFRQASDQARSNAGEAVRLYQLLLDEFPQKLIPAAEGATDQFVAVRGRVLQALMQDSALLDRYRLMQTPAAERLLESGDLERLAASHSLTEPGLEALLRLAQADFESARFHSAIHRLDEAMEHPDLTGRRAAHALFLLAMSSHYLDRPDDFAAAATALQDMGHEALPFQQQLEQAAASPDRPAIQTGLSSLDRGPAENLSGLVAQAIWSVPLENSLLRRRFAISSGEPHENPLIERRLQDADFNAAIATVAGPVAYINEGHTVRAVNRFTGQELWTYSNLKRQTNPLEHDGVEAMDPNLIAVDADAVVTLTGHAQAATRSEGGSLICLSAATGSLRWTAKFDGLVESTSGEMLFPHGGPVLADGLVFVAARKVSQQLLTSAYVVAFELATGKPRWIRYINSSGSLRPTPRPYDSLVYDRGKLYIASPVGAVAKLDAATGEVHWLHRFTVPINLMFMDQSRRPWEISAPVVTRRGVLAIEPDQRHVALLDDQTGALIESYSATASSDWNMPRYLLAGDDMVYGIGTEIRAFHLDALNEPVWRLPAAGSNQSMVSPSRPMQPSAASVATAGFELRGRVHLADAGLIIPTSDGVLIVDPATGQAMHRLPIQPVGNPLAVDSQLLMASGDRLEAFMSFGQAERMLRDRLAQHPSDPEPALSMLRLGMRVRKLPLCLEAAELANQAINRLALEDLSGAKRAKARDALLTLLLELAQSGIVGSVSDGESLYATINAAAADNRHRVEYLLAYGDWLTGHAIDRAVESYQTILSTPALAAELREVDGLVQPSSAWAAQRLSALIQQRGATVYAPQEHYAQLRLAALLAEAQPDADALLALAEEFCLSDAAARAAVECARLRLKRNDARGALAALSIAYHAAPRPQNAATLIGEFVRICQQLGWSELARNALTHVLQTHGDLQLADDTAQRKASAWLAALETATAGQPRRAAQVSLSGGKAVIVEGSIVMPYDKRASLMPPDRVLLERGGTLHLLDATTLETRPFAAIDGSGASVLRFDQRGILLWMQDEGADPRAVMLDAATGQTRWSTPRLSELLPDPSRDTRPRGIRDQMPNGEPFEPSAVLPLITSDTLILVRHSGGVIAFNLTGTAAGTVRWSPRHTIEQVHFAAASENAVVIAGVDRAIGTRRSDGLADLVPRIVILDPHTGEPLQAAQAAANSLIMTGSPSLATNRNRIKWLALTGLGVLICGSEDGVLAVDLHSGRRLWTNETYPALMAEQAWSLGQHLVLQDHRSGLRSIDPLTGKLSEPFEAPLRGEWNPLELEELILAGDRIAGRWRHRVTLNAPTTGRLLGADVIGEDTHDYRWLLPVMSADQQLQLLLISGRSEQAAFGDRPGLRSRYQYWIYSLSETAMVLAEPRALPRLDERVTRAAAIDNCLILSSENFSLLIPMPIAK